jgi:hypothetical protein
MLKKSLRIINLGFHLTGQLPIVNSALVKYLRNLEYNEAVNQRYL